MAFTQTDLDNINEAIASGAREVWYGNKRVTYNSLNDMLRAKQVIERDLGVGAGTRQRPTRTYGVYFKE